MSELHYSTLDVSGADAEMFLQGQLTADMRQIDARKPSLAAWCNPKGRVICLFRARRLEDGFALSLPSELAETAVKRLTMFRFRAKVDFATRSASAEDVDMASTPAAWRLDNLHAGIPEISAVQTEKFTPHMLNLDLLGAVSFDKGCYTGQEVVARTRYRGASRRRLLRFEAAAPVAPGAKVAARDRDIGTVLNAIGRDLLAVVPVENKDDALTVEGISLRLVPLRYLD